MIAPLLHLNGSSFDALLEGYLTAGRALRASLDALYACSPNARDYYPQGDDAFRQARAEHDARLTRVSQTLAEIELLIENLREQEDARRAGKVRP